MDVNTDVNTITYLDHTIYEFTIGDKRVFQTWNGRLFDTLDEAIAHTKEINHGSYTGLSIDPNRSV